MKKLSMPARPPSSIIRIPPKLFNVSTNAFFYADPEPDPGSAMEINGSGSRSFLY